MKRKFVFIGALAVLSALALVASCSTQRKLNAIKNGNPSASLVLGKDVYVPEVKQAQTMRDTLRIKDDEGRELLSRRRPCVTRSASRMTTVANSC